MNTICLSIKKCYFDEIKSGAKRFEYRADKPYYNRFHTMEAPFKLKLHYYSAQKLYVDVDELLLIKTPPQLLEVMGTENCWRLRLSQCEWLV